MFLINFDFFLNFFILNNYEVKYDLNFLNSKNSNKSFYYIDKSWFLSKKRFKQGKLKNKKNNFINLFYKNLLSYRSQFFFNFFFPKNFKFDLLKKKKNLIKHKVYIYNLKMYKILNLSVHSILKKSTKVINCNSDINKQSLEEIYLTFFYKKFSWFFSFFDEFFNYTSGSFFLNKNNLKQNRYKFEEQRLFFQNRFNLFNNDLNRTNISDKLVKDLNLKNFYSKNSNLSFYNFSDLNNYNGLLTNNLYYKKNLLNFFYSKKNLVNSLYKSKNFKLNFKVKSIFNSNSFNFSKIKSYKGSSLIFSKNYFKFFGSFLFNFFSFFSDFEYNYRRGFYFLFFPRVFSFSNNLGYFYNIKKYSPKNFFKFFKFYLFSKFFFFLI